MNKKLLLTQDFEIANEQYWGIVFGDPKEISSYMECDWDGKIDCAHPCQKPNDKKIWLPLLDQDTYDAFLGQTKPAHGQPFPAYGIVYWD